MGSYRLAQSSWWTLLAEDLANVYGRFATEVLAATYEQAESC
jgi:hypothetical protein